MKTYSSILVFVLYTFCNTNRASSQNYEALVVVENNLIPSQIQLPYEAEEVNGHIIYPNETENGSKIEYLYLCPAQTPEVKKDVEEISREFPEFAFSLEKNPSTENPRKCQNEVKPALFRNFHLQQSRTQCGNISSDYTSYNFGFSYIRLIRNPQSDMPDLKRKITILSLYNICMKIGEIKMFWTKHRVANGFMLQEPGFSSQQIQPPYEFSTESYSFHNYLFLNMAASYNNQEANTPYKMIPQMFVPQEDFALKIWKKTTTNYMNTASLWEKLFPLMKAINDGIRKAAVETNMKTYNSTQHSSDNLDIYTAVYYYTYRSQLKELVNNANIYPKNQFGLNVWCKFVHHERRNKGVMIFIHNLPKLPPKKINSESSDSEPEIILENAECQTPVPCDFRKWSEDTAELSDDLLNYAYCCKVSNEKVGEFFNMELNTQLELLDIDVLSTISPLKNNILN